MPLVSGTVDSHRKPIAAANSVDAPRRQRQRARRRRWRASAARRSTTACTSSAGGCRAMPAAYVPKTLNRPISASAVVATPGGEPVVLQVARHVHADEGELEAAHEVAGRQQLEAAVAEGLAQRARRCSAAAVAGCDALRLAQPERERHDDERGAGRGRRARSASRCRRSARPRRGTIRNWPNEPAAAVMPIAQLRFSGATLRPITP